MGQPSDPLAKFLAVQCFKCNKAIEIRDGITFGFVFLIFMVTQSFV